MKFLTFLATILFASSLPAVDFQKDVRPILQKHCVKCHGGPRPKAKLAMDKVDKLTQRIGTAEDAVITPGDANGSLLIKKATLPRSHDDAMPPLDRGEPLNAQQLAIVKEWINQGANFDRVEESETSSETKTPTYNNWTNIDGNTLRAQLIRLESDRVILAKEGGSEFPYPLVKLSQESQTLARELSTP